MAGIQFWTFTLVIQGFLNVYELLDDHYRIYAENVGVTSFKVRLFCVDPSANLSLCMSQGNSTILFSATMLPIRYYKTLLSGNEDDYAVYADSPFEEEKRLLMVATDRQQPLLQAQRERIPEGWRSISGRWSSLRAATT